MRTKFDTLDFLRFIRQENDSCKAIIRDYAFINEISEEDMLIMMANKFDQLNSEGDMELHHILNCS